MAKKKDKQESANDQQSSESSDAVAVMAERIQTAQDSASQAIQRAIESAAVKIQDGHDPDNLQQTANEVAEAVVAEAQAVMEHALNRTANVETNSEQSDT